MFYVFVCGSKLCFAWIRGIFNDFQNSAYSFHFRSSVEALFNDNRDNHRFLRKNMLEVARPILAIYEEAGWTENLFDSCG